MNKEKFDKFVLGTLNKLTDGCKTIISKRFENFVNTHLMEYLLKEVDHYDTAVPFTGTEEDKRLLLKYKKKRFIDVAKPCDVILVKGNLRVSHMIRTLTKSQFSHSALYIGKGKIIEFEPEGVIESDISKYLELDIRICRPVMLSKRGKRIVINHLKKMKTLKPKYDITNMEKLFFKYWYAKVRPDAKVYIGGSTDFETHYLCSGMIAHGFHKANYPIVPTLELKRKTAIKTLRNASEYKKLVRMNEKNYSQIVPGDFDSSPFFASIKFMYLNSKHSGTKRFALNDK